jgi:hypothetical protein
MRTRRGHPGSIAATSTARILVRSARMRGGTRVHDIQATSTRAPRFLRAMLWAGCGCSLRSPMMKTTERIAEQIRALPALEKLRFGWRHPDALRVSPILGRSRSGRDQHRCECSMNTNPDPLPTPARGPSRVRTCGRRRHRGILSTPHGSQPSRPTVIARMRRNHEDDRCGPRRRAGSAAEPLDPPIVSNY